MVGKAGGSIVTLHGIRHTAGALLHHLGVTYLESVQSFRHALADVKLGVRHDVTDLTSKGHGIMLMFSKRCGEVEICIYQRGVRGKN